MAAVRLQLIILTKEVAFSPVLYSLFVSRIETAEPIFTKFGEKVAHGTQKNPLEFGGNPYRVTLGLGLDRVRVN